jgi:2,4-dienoyl-CoA reductase-like NADH-dependent reductase (Old Yellow Enzyme family)
MSSESLFQPLALPRGPAMRNRFMLAPLTNQQSHPDGSLSDEEIRWLVMRAEGGFGLVMTAAAYVADGGKGFQGQLGVSDERHLPGLSRLAAALRKAGAVSSLQLYHAGARSPTELVGQPVSASDEADSGARALTLSEVEQARDAFVAAAVRAEKAGFDGVELHGAHGYLINQFLAPASNRREDRYGGDLAGRNRFLFEIIDGVRAACGRDFQLGVRLSPEMFGLQTGEVIETARQLFAGGQVDFLDMSMWDAFKEAYDPAFQGRPLLSYFAELDRGKARLGAAGKITTPEQAAAVLAQGADIAIVGRAGILHRDYPERARDPAFAPLTPPVSPKHLEAEGVSPPFMQYLHTFSLVAAE